MLYKVVDRFGPDSGDLWRDYLAQSHYGQLTSFDSVDSALRGDCPFPESGEDWSNCILEDFKLSLITNLDYARNVHSRFPNLDLIAVDIELDVDYVQHERILGYDIIDDQCGNSLIANWRNDIETFNAIEFQNNGLIEELLVALRLRDYLRRTYASDPHARGCHVWGIYDPEPLT